MTKDKLFIENLNVLEECSLEYLSSKINYIISDGMEEESSPILKCQSPIERLMYIALSFHFKIVYEYSQYYEFQIIPQKEILKGKTKYKADFLISIADFNLEKHINFVIECDGHEFHEKTKEQVRNDRQREREFMKQGYTVIRFSGSEIVDDVDHCIYEIKQIIGTRLKELHS